jgi:hypothetical protein
LDGQRGRTHESPALPIQPALQFGSKPSSMQKTHCHDQVIQIIWILVAASDVLQLATFAPETQQKTLLLQAAL